MAGILIQREENGEFPHQRENQWYLDRHEKITASEISGILDCNIYESRYDILLRKLNPLKDISNSTMDWGIMFEPVAVEFYEFIKKTKVYSLGLVTHNKHKWLGASPDGILLSNKLLEIKCPKFRNVFGVPLYYWIQMQIQMEVCDIDECDYFACSFHEYKNIDDYNSDSGHKDIQGSLTYNSEIKYYKFTDSYMETVKRDKKWFHNNVRKLQEFHNKIVYYRNLPNGIEHLQRDTYKNLRLKRKCSLIKLPLNKKVKYDQSVIRWDNWVSATRIRNFMMDDPIIDYLESHSKPSEYYVNTFQKCIMAHGNIFETTIIKQITDKYPKDIITVANYQQAKSYDKHIETIECMKKGIPIIFQGVLHDYNYKLFGVPDLLIRSDWLNKIFGYQVIKKNHGSSFSPKFHYRVIEIKYTKLIMCADGKHLRNSNKNIAANKGQLYIYNKILGNIQKYISPKSYIIGKSWVYQQGQNIYNGSSLKRIAIVNFQKNDKFIRTKSAKAIKWIRNLNKHGHEWSLTPPSVSELNPNMCNVDDKWQKIKKLIAHDNNEITELWMCGINNRIIAEKNGIKNWRTHKKLTSVQLGITGDKLAATLQIFIDLNQDIDLFKKEQKKLIVPNKITSNMYDWRNKTTEFFVDFETIMPEITSDLENVFIFMIGVGIIIDGEWIFKCFIADKLNNKCEKQILLDFHLYIESFKGKKKLYHWGSAENYLYSGAINRHPKIIRKISLITEWSDLLTLFKCEPIICRGMLNFSLKSVVKAFYDNMFIETNYDTDVDNGLQAMVMAYECYKNNNVQSYIMSNIQTYNEIDCKVMWEIIEYLRKNL
jgi:putative phage-type endonuclease